VRSQFRVVILLLLLFVGRAPAWPVTQDELATFFALIFEQGLKEHDVPGAIVAVVHDDAPLFLAGYGVADIETGARPDPAETRFRVASISKTFTALAVMQLVEKGLLDLDADVNTKLKAFKVPDAFGKPITLRHLLTHTAGFDDEYLYSARRSAAALPPLSVYLEHRLPRRVLPPGAVMSYSNHGFALAGLIVEETSGRPFSDYMRAQVFTPLEMHSSGFDLEPGPDTAFATGYTPQGPGPGLKKADFDFPCNVPAGTLAVTARDMANFMIMMLNHGEFRDQRLLSAAGIATMQARQFGHHPALPGVGLGFFEHRGGGTGWVEHTGQVWGFASLFALHPESGTGLFISLNSDEGALYQHVRARFEQTYFPAPPPREDQFVDVLEDAATRANAAAGFYRFNRIPRNSFLKFGTIASGFSSEWRVLPGDYLGTITLARIGALGAGKPLLLREVAPWEFREVASSDADQSLQPGGAHVVFREASPALAAQMFRGTNAYERIEQHEILPLRLTALGLSGLVIFLALVGYLATRYALRRWRPDTIGRAYHLSAWCLAHAAALFIIFAALLAYTMATLVPFAVSYGPPPLLPFALALPLAACFLAVLGSAGLAVACWRREGTIHMRALHGATYAAMAVFLLVLDYYGLFGYRYGTGSTPWLP